MADNKKRIQVNNGRYKRVEQGKDCIYIYTENERGELLEGEIITRNHDKVFEVKRQNGKIGIDYNTDRSPYTCSGEIFTPFETFSWNVVFEDVETGRLYHYSNIAENIEEI